jgi:hypothetical protein
MSALPPKANMLLQCKMSALGQVRTFTVGYLSTAVSQQLVPDKLAGQQEQRLVLVSSSSANLENPGKLSEERVTLQRFFAKL